MRSHVQENWVSLSFIPVFATQTLHQRTGLIAEAGADGVDVAIEAVNYGAFIRSCLELVTRAVRPSRRACRIRTGGRCSRSGRPVVPRLLACGQSRVGAASRRHHTAGEHLPGAGCASR